MTSPSHIQINTNVLKCIKAAVFMSTCKAPDIYTRIHSSLWNHVPPCIVKNLVENHAWGICNVQFSTVHISLNKFSSSMLLTFIVIEDDAYRNFEVFENKTKQNVSCYQRVQHFWSLLKAPEVTFLDVWYNLLGLSLHSLPSICVSSLGQANKALAFPALSFLPVFFPLSSQQRHAACQPRLGFVLFALNVIYVRRDKPFSHKLRP